MSTNIVPFSFEEHQVRVVMIDGDPWFVARDVAAVLGYSDLTNAVKQHTRGVANHHPIVDSLGRTQQARVITEPDVLRMIVSSKLPAAVDFERWVFEDVLPEIRRTGGYSSRPALPQSYADALRELASTVEEKELLAAKVKEYEPKVLFADSVATSDTTILVGDLAKILKGNGVEVGANRLFEWLRRDGFLIKRKGADWNMPTQYSMERGLFLVKETAVTHADGHVSINKTSKVTGKGQAYFVNKYMLEQPSGRSIADAVRSLEAVESLV